MANTKTLVLSAALACLLVASQVFGQATPAPGGLPDELHYNGDNGDNKNIDEDTNIINDNTRPSNNDNRRPSGQFNRPNRGDTSIEPSNNGFLPFQGQGGQRPSFGGQQPFGGLPPFGRLPEPFGSLFGPLSDDGLAPPPPLRPFSIIDNLFGPIRQHANNMHRTFERQFQDLERQAGEGQDVSYFNRNGVAYVRTCTTKRVSPNSDQSEQQPSRVLPIGGGDSEKSTINQMGGSDAAPSQETSNGGTSSQSGTESSRQMSQPGASADTNSQTGNDNKPAN